MTVSEAGVGVRPDALLLHQVKNGVNLLERFRDTLDGVLPYLFGHPRQVAEELAENRIGDLFATFG